jgi:hypothetical protein
LKGANSQILFGHSVDINFMFPLLTQSKIVTSIHKMPFLAQNLTLYRIVNLF